MASDNLNEVGKGLRRTRRDTDYALKKYHKPLRVERARDVFDPENLFSMEFRIEDNRESAILDLKFRKPPPLGGSTSDCVNGTCQEFILANGDHLVTLDQPYSSGSLSIFEGGTRIPAARYEEVNPAAGQVLVLQTTGPFVVCSMLEDCAEVDDPDNTCISTDSPFSPVSLNQSGVQQPDLQWTVTNFLDSTDAVSVDSDNALHMSVTNRVELTSDNISFGETWCQSWQMRFMSSDATTRLFWEFNGAVLRVFRDVQSPAVVNVVLNTLGFDYEFTVGTWYQFELSRDFVGGDLAHIVNWWPVGDTPDRSRTGETTAINTPGVEPITLETRQFDNPNPSVIEIRNLRHDCCNNTGCTPGTEFTTDIDDFERGATGSWGTASSLSIWNAPIYFGGTSSVTVDGSAGKITTDNRSDTRMRMAIDPALVSAYSASSFVEFRGLVSMVLPAYNPAPNLISPNVNVSFFTSASNYIAISIAPGNAIARQFTALAYTGIARATKFTPAATVLDTTEYWFALRLDASSQELMFKHWINGASEPTSWETAVSPTELQDVDISPGELSNVEVALTIQLVDGAALGAEYYAKVHHLEVKYEC